MKLTKHQKEIVDKIIDGKVYDITSYLCAFKKAHTQKYDIEIIQKVFDEQEKGKTYSWIEKEGYYYTNVLDEKSKVINTYRIEDKLTYWFKEYPLVKPVKAELLKTIKKQVVSYQGENYFFDLQNKEILVADSFEDIKEFIALWSYLKSEALIFDVKKIVEDEDLGVFFEEQEQKLQVNSHVTWNTYTEINSIGEDVNDVSSHTRLAPYKSIENYMKNIWKINEDMLSTCEEFVGRKIIPTASLKNYKQRKYKTVDELSIRNNLIVAWIAVIISVISVVLGNIIPLFGKKDTDYLREISNHVVEIHKQIEENKDNNELLDELESIEKQLLDVNAVLQNIENNPSEDSETTHIPSK